MIFNLDHEMETLHFIPNGENPYPSTVGNGASSKGRLKLGFKKKINNNNRTKITQCWADLFLFRLICYCNFIFGLLRILLGLFLVLFGFSLCYLGFFCVTWLFVMCAKCCNFELFGLFAVILIDLSSLIFFF